MSKKTMVFIDTDALLRAMKIRKLGTGTLPPLVGVRSDDLLRVIATGEAGKELADGLVDLLGDDILARPEVEPDPDPALADPYKGTIAELQERVRSEEIEPGVLIEVERKSENPRSTLIHWLEENYGV